MTIFKFVRSFAATTAFLAAAGAAHAAPTVGTLTSASAIAGAVASPSIEIIYDGTTTLSTLDVYVDYDSTKVQFDAGNFLSSLSAYIFGSPNSQAGAYSASYDFGFPGEVFSGSSVFSLDFLVLGTATVSIPNDVSLTFIFNDDGGNTTCIGNLGACSDDTLFPDARSVSVQVTRLADTIPVPEPATLLLMLGAGVAASLTRRRRIEARAD